MRKGGILLHISSLPSRHGIGKLGQYAFEFVDFLKKSKIKLWQVLPISPTSYGDSPYQSFSAYAGNPYFIDFDLLADENLLSPSDYDTIKWCDSPDEVNYSLIYKNIFDVLRIAYKNFKTKNQDSAYSQFVESNKFWLDEYSLYMALKLKYNGKPWYQWDKKIAMCNPDALADAVKESADDIGFFKFIQYKFNAQWSALKSYANQNDIEIVGDIPIYAAYDSADVWMHPELFKLNKRKIPTAVAGCPPDDFSKTGQLWGNPLYNWKYHKNTGFLWWINRIRYMTNMFDIVRIDHFRGFESYYSIPYGSQTAQNGKWEKAPGFELFDAVLKQLSSVRIIAEDLGFITPNVRKLLEHTAFPGMKVLEFAFDGNPFNEYLPHNFKSPNCVAYTGTHDNMTLPDWASSLDAKSKKYALKYLNLKKQKKLPCAVIRLTWASCADTAIAQMQDFLGLGARFRMNIPSTPSGNWTFRITREQLSDKLAKKIKKLNHLYARDGGSCNG